jgi:selenide,water dikinase
MAAYRLRKEQEGKELLEGISEEVIDSAVNGAINGMITSNKPVAEVMQKVPVHAATDVTGFGLKGHSENMAKLGKVDIVIDKLWVIRGTAQLTDIFGYPLFSGESKETAGGILMAVAKEDSDDLQSELDKRKIRYCEVGYVKEGPGEVHVLKDAEIIEA